MGNVKQDQRQAAPVAADLAPVIATGHGTWPGVVLQETLVKPVQPRQVLDAVRRVVQERELSTQTTGR